MYADTQLTCLFLQAIANQVEHDLRLIGDRVQKLGGTQGSARLAAALAAVRAAAGPERAAAVQEAEPQSPTKTAAGLSRCATPVDGMPALFAMCSCELASPSWPAVLLLFRFSWLPMNFCRSPSQSPIKKAARSRGEYSAAGAGPMDGAVLSR